MLRQIHRPPVIPRTSLLNLPNELLLHIASYATFEDLRCLVLANRRLQQLLAKCRYDLKFTYGDGTLANLLLEAFNAGHEGIVRYLLERGVSVMTTSPYINDTALHTAAREGNVGVVRLHMEQEGADKAARAWGKYGETPLRIAARQGHMEVLRAMLEKGVDLGHWAVHASGHSFNTHVTPLHEAAAWGQEAAIAVLLEYGAEIDSRTDDYNRSTPLHWAVENLSYQVLWNKRNPTPAIKALLASGADPKLADSSGLTALHVLSMNGKHRTIHELTYSSIKHRMTERSPPISLRGDSRIKTSHREVVTLLLDSGADINARDGVGKTPLHYAAQYSELYIINQLLDLGADINARQLTTLQTPLILTVFYSFARTSSTKIRNAVTAQLKRGADINIKDKYGRTALGIAESECWRGSRQRKLVRVMRRSADTGDFVPRVCRRGKDSWDAFWIFGERPELSD